MLIVDQLIRNYGRFQAVKGVSFQLEPGDVFGFIGSNGAGKTTTIRMLATLLEPTSGTATLNGFDIVKDAMEVRRQIGYMPDFFGLYDNVKVWEYLDFFAAIYQIPKSRRSEVIDEVLELTDLTIKRDAFVASLSRGMQQRLCLSKCLIHDPSLLLLDEPASGLDPRARAELKELIAELGRMGKIVIVSSHILSELADFCTKVGIIEGGQMKAFGAMSDIQKGFQDFKVLEIKLLSDALAAAEHLREMPLVQAVHQMGSTTLKAEFVGEHEDQAELLKSLIDHGHVVLEFIEESAELEDIFLKLTSGAVQ